MIPWPVYNRTRVDVNHVFVLAALATELIAGKVARPIGAATGVVVNPEPSVLAGWDVLFLPYPG